MTSPRLLPEAWGLWDVMACWSYLISIFISPTMVMWSYALWNVCIYWLLLFISLHVWSWDVCVWDTWANHFWVIDQLSLDYFLVTMMGLKCGFILDDVMLWHVWLNHFWSLQLVCLRYIFVIENHWILLIISDASVANRELLWSWFSMDACSWRFDTFMHIWWFYGLSFVILRFMIPWALG